MSLGAITCPETRDKVTASCIGEIRDESDAQVQLAEVQLIESGVTKTVG